MPLRGKLSREITSWGTKTRSVGNPTLRALVPQLVTPSLFVLLMQVDRVVTPLWYVIGVTGNTLSAIVWLQRRMHANNSSAVYLVALSVSDLLFLLLHFVQVGNASAHHTNDTAYRWPYHLSLIF